MSTVNKYHIRPEKPKYIHIVGRFERNPSGQMEWKPVPLSIRTFNVGSNIKKATNRRAHIKARKASRKLINA